MKCVCTFATFSYFILKSKYIQVYNKTNKFYSMVYHTFGEGIMRE